jgi:outer membrane protein OmpA-like peptidoglycan-associated protein
MRLLVFLIVGFVAAAPASAAGRVKVTRTRIALPSPIYFESGKAAIKSTSFQLLDEVAATLSTNRHIALVEIGVHTDSRGSSGWNRKLSQARAEAVLDYLVDRGVDASRLRAKGYGEDKPLDRRNTPRAQARNRRVELVILQRTK